MKLLVLLAVSVTATLLVRWPGLSFEYYCWDEHDYIAHNIYNKLSIEGFEVPFSNKWPLGHLLIYLLTYFSDPFAIHSYRLATALIDATTAAVLAFTIWRWSNVSYQWSLFISLFASLAISVCLRSSPGIIAENIANMFLVGGFSSFVLSRGNSWHHVVSFILFALACWVKPTAAFPASGVVLGYFFVGWVKGNISWIELYRWATICLIIIGACFALYFANAYNLQKYFSTSAIMYNLSSSHFSPSSLSEKFDVARVGTAFFQFMFPVFGLYAYALITSRGEHMLVINCYALGALASLLIRPAGAQTVYWLYLLPPMLAGATIGLRKIWYETKERSPAILVTAFALVALLYGWAQHIYGQTRGMYFGAGGGLRIEQQQITNIAPVVQTLQADPQFEPGKSRLFLWGMPWQLFYFSRSIPASSLLSNESYKYGVNKTKIEELAAAGLRRADYAVIDSNAVNMFPSLAVDFMLLDTKSDFAVFRRR
jgi:hypothetical protein